MTSVGEVVIARAHITVLPRLCDSETRWITGGWRVIKLSLQSFRITGVTPCVKVKVQLLGVKFIHIMNDFKRQAGASFGLKRTRPSFTQHTLVRSVPETHMETFVCV